MKLDLLNNTTREYGQSFYSGIDDIILKSDFDYYPYAKHKKNCNEWAKNSCYIKSVIYSIS